MSTTPQRMLRATELAASYRAEEGTLPEGGFVILWRMKPTGWVAALDRPWTFRPGVMAVAPNGSISIATGGDYANGATEFSPIFEPSTRT